MDAGWDVSPWSHCAKRRCDRGTTRFEKVPCNVFEVKSLTVKGEACRCCYQQDHKIVCGDASDCTVSLRFVLHIALFHEWVESEKDAMLFFAFACILPSRVVVVLDLLVFSNEPT